VLRAGDSRPAQIQSAVAAWAQALRALDRDTHVWLAAQATMAEPAAGPTPAAPPDAAALRQLMALLQNQDLSARRHFNEMAPGLHAGMGQGRFAALRQAVEGLAYDQAVALLEPLLRQPGTGSAAR
jgi:hypothetical protein